MKNLLYLLLLTPFFIFSCNDNAEEVNRLKAERDSLVQIADTKDETINDFMRAFNEVESNLETIKQKERIISLKAHGGLELDDNAKDKINDDILAIYELMKKNKQTISKLEKKLKRANINASEFKKKIARMQKMLNAKDEEIDGLKNQLSKLNIDIENLNEEIAVLNSDLDTLKHTAEVQEEVIDIQDQKLNTAFYVFGTKKELLEHKILKSEGGVIGIGKTQKLMDDFNKEYFTKVDIRKLKSIPLFAKKAELVTSHPASSYSLIGDEQVDSIVIKDPMKFWGASKYLVIKVR